MASKKTENEKEVLSAGFTLSLFGGIIILTVSILFSAWLRRDPLTFYGGILGEYWRIAEVSVGIVGVISGIFVLCSSLLIRTGHRKTGGIITLTFSLLSIIGIAGFIFGLLVGIFPLVSIMGIAGFIIGLTLGLIGGIFGIVGK
ncbi:MAG: hypothetical protein GWO20_02785 [Candidatus Korarchaeota archaeon]|nr:hypothetical protein [Candidatus Korarchaeota archaeon]NIU82398.1 hypothetical protein [Candidatus Thorarchaeota archaeon]NIW12871.1 hypothetical protein [Candidatus Thorarchaeota archaeon]NIW51065.1 hypothetical protein [Candidatus Korarchaeota archaeon]